MNFFSPSGEPFYLKKKARAFNVIVNREGTKD